MPVHPWTVHLRMPLPMLLLSMVILLPTRQTRMPTTLRIPLTVQVFTLLPPPRLAIARIHAPPAYATPARTPASPA